MSKPLTALFVDCDSYFASVEQHLDPALRGRPVVMAPVIAESSCCIAASYEARAFGVKTGMRISHARVPCPGIAIVESKPPEYIRYHHQIVEAVEDCIHVEAVLSIDEMWAWLPYNLREPANVEATLLFMRLLDRLWRDRPEPRCQLLQVGVVLARFCERTNHTPSLFQTVSDTMASFDQEKQRRLDETTDRLRARYGRKVVYFGSVQNSRETAPMRISFTHIPDLELGQD